MKLTVKLIGEDGNAFSIITRCVEAMKKEKVSQSEIDGFVAEVTCGDYDHLLQTVMAWFNIV
jgi:hypothetical protein